MTPYRRPSPATLAKRLHDRFRSKNQALAILARMEQEAGRHGVSIAYFKQVRQAIRDIKLSKVKTDKRKNPSRSRKQGMLLGDLVEICVRTNTKSELTFRPKGKLLGWLPRSKTLCVLKRGQGNPAQELEAGLVKLHKQFHNSMPSKATNYEWPDPVGRKSNVGRIVSLTYKIPKGMKSPEKNKYIWNHEFGDHGERGHGLVDDSGNYPESLMPTLQRDERGNLYIKRNPRNRYYVKDWLYW